MGNNPSLLNQVQSLPKNPVIQPVRTPDPREEAEKLRIELNMAKNDVKSKQDKYDQLVPEEANARKTHEAQREITSYVKTSDDRFNTEMKLYNILLEQVDKLANNGVVKIAKKYEEEVKKKQQLTYAKNLTTKEKAFTNRRRFLDSEPQKPLGGIFSYQSTDSQIMLAFWISYILALSSISIVLVGKYGSYFGSAKNIAILLTVFIFVMIIVAHLIIQAVATRQ
jgi:hypothetical protein